MSHGGLDALRQCNRDGNDWVERFVMDTRRRASEDVLYSLFVSYWIWRCLSKIFGAIITAERAHLPIAVRVHAGE